MIHFSCTCGHKFAKPEEDAGMAVVCPDCGLLNEIQQIPLTNDRRVRAIQAALGRHDREPRPEISEATPPKTFLQILSALIEMPNLTVIIFALIIHLLLAGSVLAMLAQLYMIGPITLALAVAVLAHWANVLDETAVQEKDDLPRVFRDMQWREDFIAPFFGVVISLALCYGPASAMFFTQLSPSNAMSIAIALGLVGTFFFPAILLTFVTSGSLANLRPDRILGVIDRSGQRYLGVVFAFVLALVPYGGALTMFTLKFMGFAGFDISVADWVTSPIVSIPVLGIGIFMMHAFCWQLALLYRAQSDDFPWVGRAHVREVQQPIPRRRPRYVESGPVQMESIVAPSTNPPEVPNNP